MNAQIKLLSEQAIEYADYYAMLSGGKEQEIFTEKFAELIVKECANHCDLLLDHKISSEWSRGTHDCSRAIKKHFGVEE